MPYRYSEAELELMQKRMDANLANFERNSGRGLPPATLKQMERAQGVRLDSDGKPVPKKARARVIAAAKAEAPKPIASLIVRAEDLERELYADHPKYAAPAIARYRKRAECDGIEFDSQLEMRRYKELKILKAAGEIKYFLRQIPFHLPGGIVSRVDFGVVYPSGQAQLGHELVIIEYEDCKAKPHKRSNDHDRVSVNKRKQVKALYGVTVKLIHKARG